MRPITRACTRAAKSAAVAQRRLIACEGKRWDRRASGGPRCPKLEKRYVVKEWKAQEACGSHWRRIRARFGRHRSALYNPAVSV